LGLQRTTTQTDEGVEHLKYRIDYKAIIHEKDYIFVEFEEEPTEEEAINAVLDLWPGTSDIEIESIVEADNGKE